MKLEFKKEFIKRHLENINRGISNTSHLPALEGISIKATNSEVTLLVSDGDLSIKEVIENNDDIKVIETGEILVPGKLFREIILKQSEHIKINTDKNKMHIFSDGSKTEINLFNIDEYPIISFDTFGKDLIIDSQKFKEIIKNVSFAAAYDDKRIILNGVNLRAGNKKIVFSATNSFRLAQERFDIDSDIEFNITILSKKIRDFLPTNVKGEIIINVDDSKIITKIKNTTISSKLIEGVYFPIDKLILDNFESEISINKKEIEKIIERVVVLSNEGKKIIRMNVDHEKLNVESKKSEIGISNSQTNAFTLKGKEFNIIFDASFFKEAISKFQGMISISFNGPQKPFIIKSDSNPELTQLILPHRSF